MPAPRILYARSKQHQLAGLPMKPSGPISYPSWISLLRDTAQYAPEVAAEGLGGFGSSFKKVVSKAKKSVTKKAKSVTKTAVKVTKIATRPVVKIGSGATKVLKGAKNTTLGLASHIPGVGKKPPSTPSHWPAVVNGRKFKNKDEYNQYLATEIYVNPYSHKPISESEYNLWLTAGKQKSFVPVGWSVGQPAPTQDMIDLMKSSDYGDGYRPATMAEFKAYVAAVDAGNKAATGVTAPTTIAEAQSTATTPSAIQQVPATSDQPMTIAEATSLVSPGAQQVPATSDMSLPAPSAEPLTINAADGGTQTEPPASSGAPIGIFAAVGAAAFFMLKK